MKMLSHCSDGTTGVTGDVLINDLIQKVILLLFQKLKRTADLFKCFFRNYNSSGTCHWNIRNSYIGADGSYTYTADQDAADALDGGTANDVFVYEVQMKVELHSKQHNYITGINDDPVAVKDVDLQ